MTLTRIMLVAALVAAAGCAPDAIIPPPPDLAASLEAGAYGENAPTGLAAPDRAVDEAWWRVYGDEQLNALVDRAFENNVDLALAAINIRNAITQAYLLGVDLRPAYSAGLTGSMSKNVKDGGSTAQNYGFNFGMSYEIDLWRRIRDLRDAQEWIVRATAEDHATTRLALAHSVVDAYYHLAYTLDAIAAVLDSLDHYERIEVLTNEKHAQGKVAGVEAVQARQSWLGSNATLIDLHSQRKTIEQTLRNLLNLGPGDALDIIPPTLVDFELADVDLNVPLTALSNRPDLRAAEFRIQAALTDVEVARKAWYPTATIGAALSSSATRTGRTFDTPTLGGNAALNFPFLKPRTLRGNLWLSESDYEKACLQFKQAVTTALNEVDTYRFAYRKAREALDNGLAKFDNDQQVADYYRTRYDEGRNEISDWLDALNTVTNSRLSTVQQRYQVLQYENRIYQAMGGRHDRPAP